MRNQLSKILRGVLLSLLGVLNFIYAKAVHATVIYATPEVMERETTKNFFLNFFEEYTGLVIFFSLLVLICLIGLVKALFLEILKKKN